MSDMKKPMRTTVLLTLFIVLTLTAVLTIYATHQTPAEETVTNTLCTYRSVAEYDYTAMLETPNEVYSNKTTLKPDEGTLYTRITRQINLTLTYTFQTTPLPSEATITYTVAQTLKTAAIEHKISETTPQTTSQKQIQIALLPINKTELDPIITKISSEIGVTTTQYYSLEIKPTFVINASTAAGTIQQIFTPTLTITFKRTDQGDITTIEPLHQTKTDALTENQTTTRQDVLLRRNVSYVLTAISVAGLIFSAYLYMKTKPKTGEKSLEKLLAPYKDLIVEASEQPKTAPQTTTVNVTTLKELAKTAEILAKPILLTRKPVPILIVIDQNTLYQHAIEIE